MALTTVRSTGIGSLPAISGANLTSLNASNISSGTLNSARFSGGKILQIKHASTSTEVSSTSSSYADTGLSCTITPTSASNTLLIEIIQNGCGVSGSEFAGLALKLLRDSTSIVDPFSANVGYRHPDTHQNRIGATGFVHKDTTYNSTSAITYKTQLKADSGYGTVFTQVNSSHHSSMVIMEVASA